MVLRKKRLAPIIKWAGGKERELSYILPKLPEHIARYFEPFVGGGAVYFSIDSERMFISDRSNELIYLYRSVAAQDKDFFAALRAVSWAWSFIGKTVRSGGDPFGALYKDWCKGRKSSGAYMKAVEKLLVREPDAFAGVSSFYPESDLKRLVNSLIEALIAKMDRMRKLEALHGRLSHEDILKNMESGLKGGFYTHLRSVYNNVASSGKVGGHEVALFYFIRNYAYASMFRYNSRGEFNVPYGGIAYNRKDLTKKIDYLGSNELIDHLARTTIGMSDFEEFLDAHSPGRNDFIFFDPPYDSDFSTYSKNVFTRDDHERLADYLKRSTDTKWMLVIKSTDFVRATYKSSEYNTMAFEKKYQVNFRERNDKEAIHLVITNY